MKELMKFNRWVQYKTKPKANEKKLDKIPCNHAGYSIDAQNPANWLSYEQVKNLKYKGFVLGNGVACGDLDGFMIEPNHKQDRFIQLIGETGAEVSISGQGIHLWFLTDYPENVVNHDFGIELYVKERFIALGMNNNGLPLAFIPKDRIQMIVDELELKTEVKPVAIKPIAPVVIKEETVNQAEISVLLDKVKNGSYGSVHAATIAGDIGDKDWSKVVLQLARAMAYHSGKNVNLMYQALKSCKALLALRSDARYSHRWNNKEWLLELCNYACK